VGLKRVIKVVFSLSLLVAVLVGNLSLNVRPWAYSAFFRLRDRAMAEFDLSKMEGGNFYQIPLENRIFFAEEVDHSRNRATGVFLQTKRGSMLQVISAKEVYQHQGEGAGGPVLLFLDGYLYEFPEEGQAGHLVKFRKSTYSLEGKEEPPVKYRVRAVPTEQLALSANPRDVAEQQGRRAAPLSAVLLALLGVPLSQTAPRQGKYGKLVAAVLTYALYYNLSAMAKAWVETGVVGTVPGIWWVPAVLASVVLALLWADVLEYGRRKRVPRSSGGSRGRGGL
jgi:lipopolysaccharide export system permease protein